MPPPADLPPPGSPPPERVSLPSLPLLLDLVQAERDKQRAHFDGLDTKAGVVLGFAGVLVTLAPDVSLPFLVPGLGAAAGAAGFALGSFWPRAYPVVEARPLRKYLPAELAFTRLRVLDTLIQMTQEVEGVLADKGRRLRTALIALALAAVCFGGGIIDAQARGDGDEQPRPGATGPARPDPTDP